MSMILTAAAIVATTGLLLGLAVLAALFLRATAGAAGLRGRIQRLFCLPEKMRARAANHYYHAYWRPR
jgi:hypothetical protein